MSLELHFHPLSSFCHKVLIALYENATPFEPVIVDLADADARAAFEAIWPIRRFPVLRDRSAGCTIPETSIIIEYLDRHYPGPVRFIPKDDEQALQTRHWDRIFDLYVNVSIQKIVTDRLRPEGENDAYGVAQARSLLVTALSLIDAQMAERTWATGEEFGMADCAAAPSLFYADKVNPLGKTHPNAARYLDRLMARPSYARVLAEAEPYFALFPKDEKVVSEKTAG
ncbi:glutathione S-transferase family protein [Microvirga terricola]|uniref:Glutathione S-transferase family protein n=1 Tax=Microvirga terricola TaxID=2719797 RepID=A0ABX0V8U1_9HYPH|nr:glutathione S-transferase family protein [Microvirga terricola]NIX75619.1 glutathione S-transferase family protein [Microvirga terricola]